MCQFIIELSPLFRLNVPMKRIFHQSIVFLSDNGTVVDAGSMFGLHQFDWVIP